MVVVCVSTVRPGVENTAWVRNDSLPARRPASCGVRELDANAWAMAWRNLVKDVPVCWWPSLGVLDSKSEDVEELGEGVEGAVRVRST